MVGFGNISIDLGFKDIRKDHPSFYNKNNQIVDKCVQASVIWRKKYSKRS